MSVIEHERTQTQVPVVEAPDLLDAAFCRIADLVSGGQWCRDYQIDPETGKGCILGLIARVTRGT